MTLEEAMSLQVGDKICNNSNGMIYTVEEVIREPNLGLPPDYKLSSSVGSGLIFSSNMANSYWEKMDD